MHVFVVDPFVADIVTWSPTDRPGTDTAGVVSLVRLSVEEGPVSDAASTSGVPGAGDVVSTVRDTAGRAGVLFPAASVTEPERVHVPSVSAGRSHDVADPTTYEHVNVEDPLVAVTVATSPAEPPPTETVGVESAVELSVDDAPVSEDAARSGPDVTTGPVPSTVMFRPVPAADVLPAGSVKVPVSAHVPSVRSGRSHDVADPTTYEHVFVVAPFVAVIVIVSPAEPPLPLTVGVVSAVRLSVDEEPVSDAVARSGAAGADGAVVSTARDNAAPAEETFPAGSVNVPDTDHEPSVNPERSHDVADPTTYEHVFVVAPFVAVMVAVSPDEPPGKEKVGVVSDVMLSESDEPVSDPVARSGAAGAEADAESTVMPNPELATDWLPAVSVSLAVNVHVPSASAGRSHDVAEPTT